MCLRILLFCPHLVMGGLGYALPTNANSSLFVLLFCCKCGQIYTYLIRDHKKIFTSKKKICRTQNLHFYILLTVKRTCPKNQQNLDIWLLPFNKTEI